MHLDARSTYTAITRVLAKSGVEFLGEASLEHQVASLSASASPSHRIADFSLAICGLKNLLATVIKSEADIVFSMLDLNCQDPVLAEVSALVEQNRAMMISEDRDAHPLLHPSPSKVYRLINLATTLLPGSNVVMNCQYGLSRSPAAAIIFVIARLRHLHPEKLIEEHIEEALAFLRVLAPRSLPSHKILAIADRIFHAEGRLVEAALQQRIHASAP